MNNVFEDKITELDNEINMAKSNLAKNFSEMSVSNYILEISNLKSLFSVSLSNPKKVIQTLDSITRLSLDEDNILRVGTKYASALINVAAILSSK